MIGQCLRELKIFVTFHPILMMCYLLSGILIVCSGRVGFMLMFSWLLMEYVGVIQMTQIEYFLPVSHEQQRKRLCIKACALAIYDNIMVSVGICNAVWNYHSFKGDFSGGLQSDVPAVVFWILFIWLISFQQEFSYIKDHLAGIYQRKINVLFRGDRWGTILLFGALGLYVMQGLVGIIWGRFISFSLFPGGRVTGNVMMLLILVVMLLDVIRLVRSIETGDYVEVEE